MNALRSLALGLGLAGSLFAAPLAAPRSGDKPQTAPAKASVPAAIAVVGCKDSKMFHLPDCKWVKEVEKAGTRVDFPSKSAAKKAHMKPCGDCLPAKAKAK
jgi:hypothetical protein